MIKSFHGNDMMTRFLDYRESLRDEISDSENEIDLCAALQENLARRSLQAKYDDLGLYRLSIASVENQYVEQLNPIVYSLFLTWHE